MVYCFRMHHFLRGLLDSLLAARKIPLSQKLRMNLRLVRG